MRIVKKLNEGQIEVTTTEERKKVVIHDKEILKKEKSDLENRIDEINNLLKEF